MKRSANHKAIVLIVLGLALLFFGQPVQASQSAAPAFRPAFQTADTTLELSGVGELRYLGLIKVYDGALYLPAETHKRQVLEDIPKRLEVRYVRSFKAKDFGPATIAGITRNVDPASYARLESRIAYHNGLYEDITPGDRVSLTYIPAVGTQLEINGTKKGTIEGADFARALFSIWLGEKPFDESFKKALLGEE
ncbi:MAG: chalcone isomerase family protein [Anaerolineae bacterium]